MSSYSSGRHHLHHHQVSWYNSDKGDDYSSRRFGGKMKELDKVVVESGHGAPVHDAHMNPLGTRLATCSSDKKIRIFDVNMDHGVSSLVGVLEGHEKPVWQLDWADPSFGTVLASCSLDGKIMVWKEGRSEDGRQRIKWEVAYSYEGHKGGGSVNSVQFGPKEWGLILACGSSDDMITLLSCPSWGNKGGEIMRGWEVKSIMKAHKCGCNAVSWAPPLGFGFGSGKDLKRFASGGGDCKVVVWKEVAESKAFIKEAELIGHTDWVRDVAWSRSTTNGYYTIASCSQDRRLIVWTKKIGDDDGKNEDGGGVNWMMQVINVFDDVIWHVSWNITGGVLVVSGGDNHISLWQRNPFNKWETNSYIDGKPERYVSAPPSPSKKKGIVGKWGTSSSIIANIKPSTCYVGN